MFNLRDFIYDQSQSSQWPLQSGHLPPNVNSSFPTLFIDDINNDNQNNNTNNSNDQTYNPNLWQPSSQRRVSFSNSADRPLKIDDNNEFFEDEHDENYENEDEDEYESPMVQKTKRKKKDRVGPNYLEKTEKRLSTMHPVVAGLPENSFMKENHAKYVAGMNTHLKFPVQSTTLQDRRQILLTIWQECYYAQDFRGAIMTLKSMSNVQSLDFPELYLLVDILRRHSDNGQLLYQLVESIVFTPINRKLESSRRRLIGLFVDAFVSMQDITRVKELFQNRLIDPAYNESSILVSYHTIISCHECVQLAQNIIHFIEKNRRSYKTKNINDDDDDDDDDHHHHHSLILPDMETFLNSPLEFKSFVEVVWNQSSSIDYYISPSSLSSRSLTTLRQLYQNSRMISIGLKTRFQSAIRINPVEDGAIDIHFYYVAYLLGSGQVEKAWPYIESMLTLLRKQMKKVLKSNMPISTIMAFKSCYTRYLNAAINYICKIELVDISGDEFNGENDENSESDKNSESDESDSNNDGNDDDESDYNRKSLHGLQKNDPDEIKESSGKLYKIIQKWLNLFAVVDINTSSMKSSSLLVYGCPPMLQVIVMADIMYRLRKISHELFVSLLCDAIESFPQTRELFSQISQSDIDFIHRTNRQKGHSPPISSMEGKLFGSYGIYYLYIWKRLAESLGPLTHTVELEESIHKDSDIMNYFNYDYQRCINDLNRISESLHGSSNDAMSIDENRFNPSSLLQSRVWWDSSILSSFQLGDFMDNITETNHITSIMEGITKLNESENNRIKNNSNSNSKIQSNQSSNSMMNPDILAKLLLQIGGKNGMFDKSLLHELMSEDGFVENQSSSFSFFSIHQINYRSEINSIENRKVLASSSASSAAASVLVLGRGILGLFTHMIVVNSHIYSQDSSFTILGIQILVQQYSIHSQSTNISEVNFILEQFRYLDRIGINIQRAIRLGIMVSIKGMSTFESYHSSSQSSTLLYGHPDGLCYDPV